MARAKVQTQIGMEDHVLNDAELLGILGEWEPAHETAKTAAGKVRGFKKKIGELLAAKELPVGEYRCGKYILTLKDREERDVAFEIKSGRELRIKMVGTE